MKIIIFFIFSIISSFSYSSDVDCDATSFSDFNFDVTKISDAEVLMDVLSDMASCSSSTFLGLGFHKITDSNVALFFNTIHLIEWLSLIVLFLYSAPLISRSILTSATSGSMEDKRTSYKYFAATMLISLTMLTPSIPIIDSDGNRNIDINFDHQLEDIAGEKFSDRNITPATFLPLYIISTANTIASIIATKATRDFEYQEKLQSHDPKPLIAPTTKHKLITLSSESNIYLHNQTTTLTEVFPGFFLKINQLDNDKPGWWKRAGSAVISGVKYAATFLYDNSIGLAFTIYDLLVNIDSVGAYANNISQYTKDANIAKLLNSKEPGLAKNAGFDEDGNLSHGNESIIKLLEPSFKKTKKIHKVFSTTETWALDDADIFTNLSDIIIYKKLICQQKLSTKYIDQKLSTKYIDRPTPPPSPDLLSKNITKDIILKFEYVTKDQSNTFTSPDLRATCKNPENDDDVYITINASDQTKLDNLSKSIKESITSLSVHILKFLNQLTDKLDSNTKNSPLLKFLENKDTSQPNYSTSKPPFSDLPTRIKPGDFGRAIQELITSSEFSQNNSLRHKIKEFSEAKVFNPDDLPEQRSCKIKLSENDTDLKKDICYNQCVAYAIATDKIKKAECLNMISAQPENITWINLPNKVLFTGNPNSDRLTNFNYVGLDKLIEPNQAILSQTVLAPILPPSLNHFNNLKEQARKDIFSIKLPDIIYLGRIMLADWLLFKSIPDRPMPATTLRLKNKLLNYAPIAPALYFYYRAYEPPELHSVLLPMLKVIGHGALYKYAKSKIEAAEYEKRTSKKLKKVYKHPPFSTTFYVLVSTPLDIVYNALKYPSLMLFIGLPFLVLFFWIYAVLRTILLFLSSLFRIPLLIATSLSNSTLDKYHDIGRLSAKMIITPSLVVIAFLASFIVINTAIIPSAFIVINEYNSTANTTPSDCASSPEKEMTDEELSICKAQEITSSIADFPLAFAYLMVSISIFMAIIIFFIYKVFGLLAKVQNKVGTIFDSKAGPSTDGSESGKSSSAIGKL